VALDDRDRAILEFERSWWKLAGSKGAAITERLGVSRTRYYRLLNALIDDPEALALDPLLVRRLHRLRRERRRARIEGRSQERVRPVRRQPHGR
jgi:hypothetical protein